MTRCVETSVVWFGVFGLVPLVYLYRIILKPETLLQLLHKVTTMSSTRSSSAHSSLHVPDINRIKNLPGYSTPVFKGKEEQRAQVESIVAAQVRDFDERIQLTACRALFHQPS